MAGCDFDIRQIVRLLGLEVSPKGDMRGQSFNVKCPLCDKKGYHLNIDRRKGTWRCAKCGEGGGTLGLYVRFGLNEPVYTKELGKKAVIEIKKQIGLDFKSNPSVYNQSDKDYINDEVQLSDEKLDAVYRKMIDMPNLRLLYGHQVSLLNRGLTKEDIVRNQYRSLPEYMCLAKSKESAVDEFKKENLYELYQNHPELKKLKKRDIISGLSIGVYLSQFLNIDLTGVPGFFKIKGLWCFKYTAGILLPIRNAKKQIVGFQIRTDKGKVRYITNSSKGYDCGTTGVCRVHYPVNNPKLGPNTVVYITEGSLKADVSLALTQNPNIAYVSILGVNATKQLEKELKYLKECGCKKIVNAFDIDKITNPNVLKANIKIKKLIDSIQCFCYSPLFWDKKTAKQVYLSQKEVLEQNNIEVKYNTSDIFYRIIRNTVVLKNHHIDFESEWPNPNTKGIDDYLKLCRPD